MVEGIVEKRTLVLTSKPKKTRYRPGEAIDLDGIAFSFGSEDVTDRVAYNIEPEQVWRAKDKAVSVSGIYADETGASHVTSFTLRKKRRIWPLVVALLICAAAATSAFLVWQQMRPGDDTGSHVMAANGMSREEAQKMLDEQTERSRITVSIAPKMRLGDDGRLRVNFAVAEDNNGFSERLEIRQNDQLVYKTGIVPPGNILEWTGGTVDAHVGSAVATVYAVTENGNDSGNPVSVEIEIVDRGEDEIGDFNGEPQA